MAKFVLMTIQVNLLVTHGEGKTNSPELSLLKILLLVNHYTISWPPPWISHLFSQ